ncbi:MAG: sugar phosphate isomerase/epimerase family protein [Rectinemataceae bacterium]
MFRIALSSSVFPDLGPDKVVGRAKELGFDGIEWTGQLHLGSGDRDRANTLLMTTLRAGLTIASYAPAKALPSACEDRVAIEEALETARSINAPIVRIGLGPGCRSEGRQRVIFLDKLRRIGDLAGSFGISLALSPAAGTPLDSLVEALCLADELSHPFVSLSWELLADEPDEESTILIEDDPGAFTLLRMGSGRVGAGNPRSGALNLEPELWERILRAYSGKPGSSQVGCFTLLGRDRIDNEAGLQFLAEDLAFARQLWDLENAFTRR